MRFQKIRKMTEKKTSHIHSDEGCKRQIVSVQWQSQTPFLECLLISYTLYAKNIEEHFRDACQQGDLETLKRVLASLNQRETDLLLHSQSTCTGTPLFDAIISHQPHIVECLLDLNVIDLELECSVNIFYPILFRDTCTALCVACACGDVGITTMLLEHDSDVNHTSHHSSPLIYASEYNNVELTSILLQYGASIKEVPKGLKTQDAVLPLYQACLLGHKDTAEILMKSGTSGLDPEKKVCLLGLLGAQCINKHQDYDSGLKYWKQALKHLELLSTKCERGSAESRAGSVAGDLVSKLQKLYLREITIGETYFGSGLASAGFPSSSGGASNVTERTVNNANGARMTQCSVLRDMQLCTTVEALDKIADDHRALQFQGLLVLENILGPSHPETTQQVSHAARLALEHGDLTVACKLFLYIIESNECRDHTITATEYTSQLADLLLNVFINYPENLTAIENFPDLLLAALELILTGATKTYDLLASGGSMKEHSMSYFDSQVKQHSKVKLLSEMIETLMGFLRILIDQQLNGEQRQNMYRILHRFINLRNHKAAASKFNLEPELFKIAVFGGQSTSSTLYFIQEELFPETQVLELLIKCGANVNCQDTVCGDTPLIFSLDCPKPDQFIIEMLLRSDAHIDICNRYGVTPYSLLFRQGQLGFHPFKYISLKCLSARAIVTFGVPYCGQVPHTLEEFIPWHGVARSNRHFKKSASADNVVSVVSVRSEMEASEKD